MLDRTPLYPGRIKLALVEGTENVYDVVRANEPTQEGTPLNKGNLLSDETAGLFGLDNTAVPNDVLWLLSQYIPSPYGLIIIQAVDNNGEPTAASLAVSPNVEGASEFTVGSNGFYSVYAQPGTYTLSSPSASSAYQVLSPSTMEITVEVGKPVVAKFAVAKSDSGELDFTSSRTFVVPEWMTSIDIFAVGGGASGDAVVYDSTYASACCGGGGGYTATLLGLNLAGKTLTITIGSGGAAAVAYNENVAAPTLEVQGNNGGQTSVTVDGETIISAEGGTWPSSGGCNGGSGGGGAGEGGTDGSDGSPSGSSNAGNGQGSTTRKFGESTGELYSGGGGGCDSSASASSVAYPGGSGGGGDGYYVYLKSTPTATTTYYAENATKYGGGGGGCKVCTSYSGVSLQYAKAVSGKGYQGLVSIRW